MKSTLFVPKPKMKPIPRDSKGQFSTIDAKPSKRALVIFLGVVVIVATFSWTAAYQASPEARLAELMKRVHYVDGTNVKIINKVVEGRITYYAKTGYRMANGKYPTEGYVATSDRTIPLGTVVRIDGGDYIVGDRTAYWVHTKFDKPTFDIYSDKTNEELVKVGTHTAEVSFYATR